MIEGGLIIAGAVIFLAGLMAFLQQRHNPIVFFFFLTTMSAAIWAICIATFLLTSSPEVMVASALLYYIAAAFLAVAVLLIGYGLRYGRVPSDRTMMLIMAPFLVIALLMAVNPGIMIASVIVGEQNTAILQPVPYGFYTVYFLSYYIAALVLLYQAYQRATGQWQKSYGYLFMAYVVGGAVGAGFNLILPAFGNYSLIWIGPLVVFPFLMIVYVAIARYGLFDIRLALSRAIAYVVTLSVLATLYIVAITLISQWFLPESARRDVDILTVVLILVFVLIFQPIRRFFDRVTNSIFFRHRYKRDEFYANLNDILTSSIDLQATFRRAASLIAAMFSTERVFFVVSSQERILNIGTKGHPRLARADFLQMQQWWEGDNKHRSIIIRSVLGDSNESGDMKRLMKSYGVEMALVLRQADVIHGLLLVGERHSGRYNVRDFTVLETAADELTIALQNAMSLREVSLLNATLQQRIDAATKELRRNNAQLQRLDEAKDEFISMASHQLRTPLTSIKGYLDMILEGDAGEVTPMQRKFLSEAFTSSERMVFLINDFLNISRLQTGRFAIEKRPVDLAKVVLEEIDGLKINAAGRTLKFKTEIAGDIPLLMLDENKIRQVVMNFSDNAIYYSPPGEVITITLRREKGDIVFTVKDNGIGVPKKEQAELFTKFFRGSNARKQRPDGTGVGLYLAKRVIKGHSGDIIFSSTEGRGSTFGFRLPISALRVRDDANKLNDKPNDH